MGLNLNILSAGGGGGSGQGIAKYATAANLPAGAADGDVAIVLDTNNLYSYDSGVAGWVIIGGPGVAITVADTNSVDLTLTLNVLTADLRIPGITGLPNGAQGISLQIYAGASPGLEAFIMGNTVQERTSNVLQFFGSTFAIMGTTLGIQVNQASGSTPGYVSAADFAGFAAGVSALLNTQFPILGGGRVDTGLTLSIPQADGSTGGYLSPTDWTTFNNKMSQGSTIAQLGNIVANSVLGNPTGGAAGITTMSVAGTKTLLGISNNNFGDVSVGSFSYVSFAQGLTISPAQVLQLGWGDTTNPGAIGPTHQVFSGDKRTTGSLGTDKFVQFYGGSLIQIGTTNVASAYNLFLPVAQGGTFTNLFNTGLGTLEWRHPNVLIGYRTVTNAGATLAFQDRMIEVSTGATNQTINIGYAASGNTGVNFYIQKIDSGLGNVTVQAPDGINGVTNFTFGTQWEAHQIVCNGVGFRVIS